MNQILYSKKNGERKTKKLVFAFFIIIILLLIFSISFALANKRNNKILKGVYVNNIDVGGLSKEEVIAKVEEQLERVKNSKINLKLGNYSKTVTGEDLGATYLSGYADEAYNYGRSGNIISDNYTILSSYFNKRHEVVAELALDNAKCKDVIDEITEQLSEMVANDTYEILDDKIELQKGKAGRSINEEKLEEILGNNLHGEKVEVEVPVEIANPVRVDFNKLYDEAYIEKVDASYSDENGFEVTKDVTGRYFDKEKAIEDYAKLADGEKMDIELIFVEPKVRVSDLNNVLFKDVLATYQTKYDKYNTNRSTNLEIAARNINGTILYPGDEFSYNDTVGERSAARGFKEAHVFSGGRVVDGLGGGICQVSSTLYNSVLLSNLEVTERKAHMMHTGYLDPGRDATVVYGSIDFRFKNNRKTPVKIEATVKNGICTTTILGLKEENEPKVEIKTVILKVIPYTTITENDPTLNEGTTQVTQTPLNGYVSETYKIIKDSTGKEISNTLISKDSYNQTSKIIKVGTKKVEPDPTPVPEDPTPVETTPPSSLPTGWDNPESPYALTDEGENSYI